MHTTDHLNVALDGKYRIERELGRGGMATVYLAEDLKRRRRVAIKVLHPELTAVIGSERFLKEIELTASLRSIASHHERSEGSALLFYVCRPSTAKRYAPDSSARRNCQSPMRS